MQAAPAWLDLDATVDKSIGLIKEAAEQGRQTDRLSEAFIPGYPWYIWMDSPAWAIGRGFVQRYFDNSLSYDSPQAETSAAGGKQARHHRGARAVRARRRQSLSGAMADRPRRRHHRQAPQAAADPCRADGLWRGRRQRSRRSCPTRHRPYRRLVLLGASAAAVEIRDVCAERAGSCRGLAELFALRSVCPALGAEVNNAASTIYAVEGSCFVLAPCATVSQAMIDELCDTPDKNASAPCRRRLCRDLWPGRFIARRQAGAGSGGLSMPTSISA